MFAQHDTGTVIESQPDWLTATVHNEDDTLKLRNLTEPWEISELADGNRAVPFRLMGYTGWRTGRIAYGERENAALVQLSGDFANQYFRYVYQLKPHVTRLDLATTVQFGYCPDDWPYIMYQEASAYYRAHPSSALPSIIQDADLGATLMIGHRTSDFFHRAYLKERECLARNDKDGAGDYAQCVRFECEIKGLAAPGLAKQLSESIHWPTFCQQWNHDYLTAHGICPPFRVGRPTGS